MTEPSRGSGTGRTRGRIWALPAALLAALVLSNTAGAETGPAPVEQVARAAENALAPIAGALPPLGAGATPSTTAPVPSLPAIAPAPAPIDPPLSQAPPGSASQTGEAAGNTAEEATGGGSAAAPAVPIVAAAVPAGGADGAGVEARRAVGRGGGVRGSGLRWEGAPPPAVAEYSLRPRAQAPLAAGETGLVPGENASSPSSDFSPQGLWLGADPPLPVAVFYVVLFGTLAALWMLSRRELGLRSGWRRWKL